MNQRKNLRESMYLTLLTANWRCLAVPRLAYAYFHDALRFARNSATFSFKKHSKLIGRIVRYYHSLEKGLSLPDVKPVFGQPIALRLMRLVLVAEREGLGGHAQIRAARAVLKDYTRHIGSPAASAIPGLLELAVEEESKANSTGGVDVVACDELFRQANGPFPELLKARRSIRWFTDESVDEHLLVRAIEMAQQSPSVCNRQAGRATYTLDRNKIKAALALQDGNRGFGSSIRALFIVTSDLSVFGGPDERNQVFVDGGLFSMTLMYALCYLGLGACPLNWMVDPARDSKLRRLAGIKSCESIVMLMAVGHIPETVKIARSCRNDLGKVATRW